MWQVKLVWSWIEIGFGLLIIMVLLGLAIKPSKEKILITNNDEMALNKAKQELDSYDYYEIKSIESLNQKTTVIASTGYLEVAIDIDNKTGKTISKEKLARG